MKALRNKTIGLVFPAVPGYSETFFKSKIEGLLKNGAAVVVFTPKSAKSKQQFPYKIETAPVLHGSGIAVGYRSVIELIKAFLFNYKKSVHYLALEKEDGFNILQRLKKLIANHYILSQKLDWLHFGFGTMALGRENVAPAIGAKMAVSFRGFDIGIYPLKHPNCYKKLFQQVDKIHVISEDIAELLYQQGLEKTKPLNKITPAIDTLFFENRMEGNSSNAQLVTIGRLHWKKGLEYTLEALSILKSRGLNFHYTIIGDGPERERLVFAAHQLGVQNNVTFAGKLTPAGVKKQLAQATIYVQYSIQEGFCNATLEAQAMGLLCVVSDAEGLSENVLDNETGWVVAKRNPLLLADQLCAVLVLNEEEKERIRSNAVKRVKSEFNIEKQTQEFVAFYND